MTWRAGFRWGRRRAAPELDGSAARAARSASHQERIEWVRNVPGEVR